MITRNPSSYLRHEATTLINLYPLILTLAPAAMGLSLRKSQTPVRHYILLSLPQRGTRPLRGDSWYGAVGVRAISICRNNGLAERHPPGRGNDVGHGDVPMQFRPALTFASNYVVPPGLTIVSIATLMTTPPLLSGVRHFMSHVDENSPIK